MFKTLSLELGDPNQSLFVARLDNPRLSFGTLKKIIPINEILRKKANKFIIFSKVIIYELFSIALYEPII